LKSSDLHALLNSMVFLGFASALSTKRICAMPAGLLATSSFMIEANFLAYRIPLRAAKLAILSVSFIFWGF